MSPGRASRAARAPAFRGSAPLFAALGDETRLRLVSRLCARGPASIARLASGAGVTRQAVTKHLHVLARAGVIRGARRGREHVWELDPAQLAEARRHLESISRGWDEALSRLKDFVER
jgi:DNA-binding transcriptional ArsR family regulator